MLPSSWVSNALDIVRTARADHDWQTPNYAFFSIHKGKLYGDGGMMSRLVPLARQQPLEAAYDDIPEERWTGRRPSPCLFVAAGSGLSG